MQEVNEKEKQLFVRYGSAASEAMFDFPCHFFHIAGYTGFIPYRQDSKCAIVFGEPICPPEETPFLTEAFHHYCKKNKLSIIYLIVSKKFATDVKDFCPVSLGVCEEMIFNPQIDLEQISRRLKNRVNKAVNHGLTLHEYLPYDAKIEEALTEIGIQWRNSIKGPNLYLGHLNFFEQYIGKRWFYVKEGEKITAMIMLSKLEAHEGWLLKFLVTSPDAFPETSEFLMISVLKILQKENCHFLSKGMMPAAFLEEIKGLGRFSSYIAKKTYSFIHNTYHFEKRKEYWQRYHPKTEPAYILLSRPSIGFHEIKALIKTFKPSRFPKPTKNLINT